MPGVPWKVFWKSSKTMSAADPYFQFPLCALALPSDVLATIISYGAVEAGAAVIRSASKEALASLCVEHGLPKTKGTSWELAAEIGAKVCQITIGSREQAIQRHVALCDHLSKWEALHGKDSTVRVEKGLCFKVRDNDGFSFREFRVLCAIYSAIGGKAYPVILPLRMINARSCGCKSEVVLTEELSANRVLDRLSIKQLRGTVARLHELKFFARCTPDRHGRKTYYSHRMSGEELREKIFQKATYSATFKDEERAKDKSLCTRIDKAKQQTKSLPIKAALSLPFGEIGEVKGTRKDNAGATRGQPEGNARATIIEIPSIEIPVIEILPNKNPLNESPPAPKGGDCDFQEKGIEEHAVAISQTPPKAEAKPEDGYLYEGRFLASHNVNLLVRQRPELAEEILKAKPARRFPDGRIEPAA